MEFANYGQNTLPEATGKRPFPYSSKRDADWPLTLPTGIQEISQKQKISEAGLQMHPSSRQIPWCYFAI